MKEVASASEWPAGVACDEITELVLSKDDFKFNAAHFVVLEVGK